MLLLASTLAGGSSNSEWATARCAEIASMPVQRRKNAWRAADRRQAEKKKKKKKKKHTHRLRSKSPAHFHATTTSLHRRAAASSGYDGYVSHLFQVAAAETTWPATRSAPGHASPSRITGETKALSTAACAPCPGGAAIGQHLDATRVERGRIDVHVSEQDVRGHACASLTAHAGRCPFERRTPAPKTPAVGQAAR